MEDKAKKIVKDKLDTINRIKTVKIPTPEERRAQIAARKQKESNLQEVFSWSTKKLDDGSYKWQVHKITHGEPLSVLHSGECDSRAKAVGLAKKHVMTYRQTSPITEMFKDTREVVQAAAGKGHWGIQGRDVTIYKTGAVAMNGGHYISVKNNGDTNKHPTMKHALEHILKEENMESIGESLDHLQQSLADKDINSKIENGKLIVHKSNLEKAKAHTKKLGHDIEVKSGLNEGKMLTLKEYMNREIEHDETVELDESLVLEAVPTRSELMDKVEAHRKFGNNVTSHGVNSSKAHITVVDKEGIKRTYHYTSTGTKVETHGEAGSGEKAATVKTPDEKRGRGRPSGSSGSYSRRVAEDLENSEELFLEDYDLEDLEEFYESNDVEMLDELSKEKMTDYLKKANNQISSPFSSRKTVSKIGQRNSSIKTAVKKLTGE